MMERSHGSRRSCFNQLWNHLESIFVDHDKKLCQVLSQPWHIDGKILENYFFSLRFAIFTFSK